MNPKRKNLREKKQAPPFSLLFPVRSAAVILLFLLLLINTKCTVGKAAKPERIQIILISIDTLRGDHLSSYGYHRDTTPHLSNLIQDSVYYNHAYANGCWTMPSHMTMLTGTLPSRHGINQDWQSITDVLRGNGEVPKLNKSIKTIPEVLQSANVNSISFAKLPNRLGFKRGFSKKNNIDPLSSNRRFFEILKELEKQKNNNFFIFIHTWMVHAPYSNSHYLEKKIDGRIRHQIDHFRKYGRDFGSISSEFNRFLVKNKLYNKRTCVALYDSGIHYVDRYIGKLIEKCKQLGIYDHVMLIVTSDHGEHFEEHYTGYFYGYHGKDFYEEFIQVPLIIKYPSAKIYEDRNGNTRPRKDQKPVSLVDLMPTILDYYEVQSPPFVQGQSLLQKETTDNPGIIISEAVSSGDIEIKMIRAGDLKYIVTINEPGGPGRLNNDPASITSRRLYDVKNDPLEKNDLYKNPKYKQLTINLEKMLFNVVKDSLKPGLSPGKTTVDQKTLEQMKALGYIK